MKSIKSSVVLLLWIFFASSLKAQQSSYYGHSISPHTVAGKPLRVLMVFVEFDQDGQNCLPINNSCWPAGGLPFQPEDYFDDQPSSMDISVQ